MDIIYYNHEFKKRYLDESTTTSNAKSLFGEAMKVETALEKDCGLWSLEETVDFLNLYGPSDITQIRKWVSAIAAYQSYAQRTAVRRITKEEIDIQHLILRTFFKEPRDMLGELQQVVDLDQGYYSVAAMCLAWAGVQLEDIPKLPPDVLDEKNKTLSYSVYRIKLDDEIYDVLHTYAHMKYASRSNNGRFDVHREDTGFFLYQMVGENFRKAIRAPTLKNIQSTITTLAKIYKDSTGVDSRLSLGSAQKSGKYFRLYQAELRNEVDLNTKSAEDIYRSYLDNRHDYYDNRFNYQQYKKAFNLD